MGTSHAEVAPHRTSAPVINRSCELYEAKRYVFRICIYTSYNRFKDLRRQSSRDSVEPISHRPKAYCCTFIHAAMSGYTDQCLLMGNFVMVSYPLPGRCGGSRWIKLRFQNLRATQRRSRI